MDIKPFKDEQGSRKDQVKNMFNRIAGNYDFLNHLLSFNADKRWRRVLYRQVRDFQYKERNEKPKLEVLDVATGTGDVAFILNRLSEVKITGLDISEEMVKIAREKSKKKSAPIEFLVGDSEDMPFPEHTFDVITVAFGVRNFENLTAGLSEFKRVLKPGGRIYIMEFSKPSKGLFSCFYFFYSGKILPFIASLFTEEPRAYQYLPDSIQAFPSGEEMLELMRESGFTGVQARKLSFGIATIYQGKPIQ